MNEIIKLNKGNYSGKVQNLKEYAGFITSKTTYIDNYNTEFHYHENPHLSFILQGGNFEHKKSQKSVKNTGDVLFYHSGELHKTIPTNQQTKNLNLEIDINFLKENFISELELHNIVEHGLNSRLFLSFPIFSFSQKVLVLNSNTEFLTIKEGKSVYENIWNVNPEYETDVFVTNPFDKQKVVTFYSDIDSLSFKVKPNKKYNFVVLLNGKKAKTQINTGLELKPTLTPKLFYNKINNIHSENDTIPFKLGTDNRIYIQGAINESDTINFLFDLNAGANVINEYILNSKVSVKADGNQENTGSDGVMNIKTSSNNKMSINHLVWENVPLLIIPYGQSPFDAVLSWRSFEDKILEIDYDNNILIIHDELPDLSSDYSILETKMISGIPYVKCVLSIGEKDVQGWFGFDTGGNGELLMSQKFASENQLNGLMKQIGSAKATGSSGITHDLKIVKLPKLKLGNYELYRIPLGIYDEDPEGVSDNEVLGNNILKRFNCIIDFKNNQIYMKPNKLLYSTM